MPPSFPICTHSPDDPHTNELAGIAYIYCNLVTPGEFGERDLASMAIFAISQPFRFGAASSLRYGLMAFSSAVCHFSRGILADQAGHKRSIFGSISFSAEEIAGGRVQTNPVASSAGACEPREPEEIWRCPRSFPYPQEMTGFYSVYLRTRLLPSVLLIIYSISLSSCSARREPSSVFRMPDNVLQRGRIVFNGSRDVSHRRSAFLSLFGQPAGINLPSSSFSRNFAPAF